MNNEQFYTDIDANIKELLNHPVPEILLKENLRLNAFLKTQLGEKDKKKDMAKGEIGETIIRNVLILKGFKIIKKHGSWTYDTILEKDKIPLMFEIKTDFFCGSRKDNVNVALELRAHHGVGSLLRTSADCIGYLLPKQDMIGFITTKKLQKLIKEKVICYILTKSQNLSLLTEQKKEQLKDISVSKNELELMDTYSIIMKFIDFLPSWYIKDEQGYKISPDSGDKNSGGVNLLMPFDEFKKEFRVDTF